MTKLARAGEVRILTLGGVAYAFAAPGVYDMGKLRRRLTLEGVRRPTLTEYEVQAKAGVRAMGAAVGEAEEGERQEDLLDRFYRAMAPVDEDDIDEPDLEARAAIVAERVQERRAELAALAPDILAIEANLDRHWPAWRELRADAEYWDEISRIDATRLKLIKRDDEALERDEEGWLTEGAYLSIEDKHLAPLGMFALALLAPSETERKN